MRLISYAQNGEDVLLWRALGAVRHGFYIDVGANHPETDSVTRLFYDAGWHGINIEPLPAFHQLLLRDRPRDINLALACGAADGVITLYDTPSVDGWASTDATTAAAHRAAGVSIIERQVPLRTLAGICAEHAPAAIHFLKIDVEGFEAEVLRGMDLQRWRPWVLVIEATVPGAPATNYQQWEALVTQHAYQFAYFDGLNRYYVAAEHAHLLSALAVQANVFDAYVSHHLHRALHRVQALDAELARARQEQSAWALQLEAELKTLQASRSWRLTRPLRALARLRQQRPVRRALMWLALQPTVRRTAFAMLRRVPGLEARFLRWYAGVRGNALAAMPVAVDVPPALAHLPQSARQVLADLERPLAFSDN